LAGPGEFAFLLVAWAILTGVVEPKKAVSSRESHGHQELSRVNKVHGVFSA
jgi:hypothetical protein